MLQHEFHSAGNKHYSHPVDLGIVGESEAIRSLVQQVRTVARSSVSVMICGATGTGKELIARAIHKCSSVASSPYIPVNCGAIPFDLVESELFGHERGAFTGAHARRIGYFENANKGTLFLDEIGDMRYEMQVKLLRVLDSGSITRVGSNVSLPLDVRVISATHRDMEQYISDGRFHEDLFYRLGVVLLHVPALAERREDIPELIEHFQKYEEEERGFISILLLSSGLRHTLGLATFVNCVTLSNGHLSYTLLKSLMPVPLSSCLAARRPADLPRNSLGPRPRPRRNLILLRRP